MKLKSCDVRLHFIYDIIFIIHVCNFVRKAVSLGWLRSRRCFSPFKVAATLIKLAKNVRLQICYVEHVF